MKFVVRRLESSLRQQQQRHLSAVIGLFLIGTTTAAYVQLSPGVQSGCADGSTEGLQGKKHLRLAACEGLWEGHVSNASNLCAPGWSVCGWNTADILSTINWDDAMKLPGCYALNAAQDNGQCRPCIDDIHQDDLAGVGSGCPHRTQGTDSCISGGQMDASCCMDSRFKRACTYRPGFVTGALCCRHVGTAPKFVVRPSLMTHSQVGGMFVLSCQAIGSPVPRITWLRDGRAISIDTSVPRRVAALESGYLIVSDAQLSDSDVYQCVATNAIGNVTAIARVIVTEYPSGCADGTTDGLADYEEIHACRGRWKGHVKRAKSLCASGWQVCSPRHSSNLKLLTWDDVNDRLDGCYAYNAANTLNLCSVCQRDEMAGVGRQCGRHRVGQKSCLADGRIDVHSNKVNSQTAKCEYSANKTTGVLCCRRPEKWQLAYRWSAPKCQPKCQNGGVCVADGQCHCAPGYKGALCQNPICPGGCIPNSVCIRPAMCRCLDEYSGPKCKIYQHGATSHPNITFTPAESSTSFTPTSAVSGSVGKPLKVKYPLSKSPMFSLPPSTAAQTSSSGEHETHRQQMTTSSSVSGRAVHPCKCLNGGRCISLRSQSVAAASIATDSEYLQRERCKCPPTHQGNRCQHRIGQLSISAKSQSSADINGTEQ